MVQYQKGKFIDQTEITVEQWAEFVYDGNENRKPLQEVSSQYKHHQVFYPTKQPDSLFRAFGKIDYYNLPVPFEYFDTLNYGELREILDFPITGISHEDAQAYCQWRTQKYNALNTNHTKQSLHFTLPDSVVYLIEVPANLKKFSPEEKDIYPVKSKKHALVNGFKVYGLQSNVPEMTTKKGVLYGGNNEDSPNAIYPGFRCAGVVKD